MKIEKFTVQMNINDIDLIHASTQEESDKLRSMVSEATAYIQSFEWCPEVVERYLGYGLADIIVVVLFKFAEPVDSTDKWLWVIEGDLPSAYLVTDDAADPISAARIYCEMMEEWAYAVMNGSSLEEMYPVDVVPTKEHAEMLLSRVNFIQEKIIQVAMRSEKLPGSANFDDAS